MPAPRAGGARRGGDRGGGPRRVSPRARLGVHRAARFGRRRGLRPVALAPRPRDARPPRGGRRPGAAGRRPPVSAGRIRPVNRATLAAALLSGATLAALLAVSAGTFAGCGEDSAGKPAPAGG